MKWNDEMGRSWKTRQENGLVWNKMWFEAITGRFVLERACTGKLYCYKQCAKRLQEDQEKVLGSPVKKLCLCGFGDETVKFGSSRAFEQASMQEPANI